LTSFHPFSNIQYFTRLANDPDVPPVRSHKNFIHRRGRRNDVTFLYIMYRK